MSGALNSNGHCSPGATAVFRRRLLATTGAGPSAYDVSRSSTTMSAVVDGESAGMATTPRIRLTCVSPVAAQSPLDRRKRIQWTRYGFGCDRQIGVAQYLRKA